MKKIAFNLRILLSTILIFISGCGAEKEEASLGNDLIVEAPLAGSFYVVGYKGDSFSIYQTHKLIGGISGDTDWTQACSVPVGDFNSSAADIVCLVEAHELDLYARGLTLKMSVPAGLCDYALEVPYTYFSRLAGMGPAGPFAYTSTDPVCAFDYTSGGGPNCCEGNFSISAGTATQPARTGKYTGKVSNCLSGPNIAEFDKDSIGRPMSKLYTESTSGLAVSRKMTPPIESGLNSNVWIANYFNPAQHTHLSTYSPTIDLLGGTNAPIAFDPAVTATADVVTANPFQTYICYDRNREIKARIRVMVREWNMISELKQGGNPDTAGASGSDPINDFFDWRDFETIGPIRFPGADE